MKKLLLFSAFVFFIVSCSKETNKIQLDEPKDQVFNLTKEILISSENGDASITILANFDNEELLEILNERQFELCVKYENEPIQNLETLLESGYDNDKPNVKIEITKVKLPDGAIGFTLKNNMSKLKSLADIKYYAYYIADGVSGTRVTLGPNGGQIKVRVGVLWTTSQWFYDNILTSTLKVYNTYVQTNPGATEEFYKIRVRVDIQVIPGDHTVTWLYY